MLSEARPILLERTGASSFPARDRLAPRAVEELLAPKGDGTLTRVWVVYATSAARKRFRDVLPAFLRRQLGESAESAVASLEARLRDLGDNQCVRLGSLEIGFVSPPQADRHLLAACEPASLKSWVQAWLPEIAAPNSQSTAFLVETLAAADREGVGRACDPKFQLRQLLAEAGVVTQFFTSDSFSAPRKGLDVGRQEDHAAMNAVVDLLRAAGSFMRRFPCADVEPGTLLVGVYSKAEYRYKHGERFFFSLVAASAGSTEALGYVPGQGWLPLGQATVRYLAAAPEYGRDAAKAEIEKAIDQLRVRDPARRMVLYLDAVGCRRYWNCLADSGSTYPEVWMCRDRTAVVRVRALSDEVPRIAGQHEWKDDLVPALYTAFRPVTVANPDGRTATLLVSGSSVMDRTQEARKVSRFAASDRGLKQDWHSINSTEFLVLDSGGWSEEEVVRQSLALCRGAPTWERVLRWPAPLHLARSIVRDLPGVEPDLEV